MSKKKVLFPFVEAGFGHIMAEKAICDAFEKKYGDEFEIIRSDFFKEVGTPAAIKFERKMCDEVKKYTKSAAYGYLSTAVMNIFGSNISSGFIMKFFKPGVYKDSLSYLDKIKPDVVVSTHWSTNFYAEHMKDKPLTVMYGPDAHLNALFRYKCDLDMISVKWGYDRARKHFKRRFNDDNLKLVPSAIRGEAFEIERDKKKLRESLGLEDKFTAIVMEGGYGIGPTARLCEAILKADPDINLIAMCGKNEQLKNHLEKLEKGKNISFYPLAFREDVLKFIAASDLYFGKSGSGILEPAFFGVPMVVIRSVHTVERFIANYYVNIVGNAVRIKKPEKCVEFLLSAMGGGEKYNAMIKAKENLQPFGGEGIADEIYRLIKSRE